MKIKAPPTAKPRIEMLPLIDIVFLLLVVFIYAMLSMAVHHGMPVQLPTSTTAVLNKEDLLSVTVNADGTVHINNDPVALAALAATLKEKPGIGPRTKVLVFGDRNLSYQILFQVLDQIRLAGINRISLQAEPEPGS